MNEAMGLGTLEQAAESVGLSRDAIYRAAIKLRRIKAHRVISRINGRLRARWMVNLQETQNYFNQTTLVEEN